VTGLRILCQSHPVCDVLVSTGVLDHLCLVHSHQLVVGIAVLMEGDIDGT